MGSSAKGGSSGSQTTGFRYYFSILMGLCRGPVDEIVLITCGGLLAWDGSPIRAGVAYGASPAGNLLTTISGLGNSVGASPTQNGGGEWLGGSITDNFEEVPIWKPDLFGGDTKEGGLDGTFDMQMGASNQILGGRIKDIMAGIRLSAMRGVTTLFYDGQICANNPYPKAFKFRVRRALKGWDGDPWYPERAIIQMSDAAIPGYSRQDVSGHTYGVFSNVDGTTTTVDTAVDGSQTFTTYNPQTGLTSSVAVPTEFNDIRAMNPAHIIYECCTNRDWGRGLDRALMDEVSFTSSANTLWDEGFGMCLKWSRADDIDTFVQSVINHIGGMLYTDKLTGLFCLRLIRGGYVVSSLPKFDYNSGLLEVTSVETGASDVTANEIIVKYNSPVLNTDKEARVQNIASINSTGSIFSQTKQYPGIPTSQLALRVAQRDLKVMSGGLKRVTAVMDRRAYQIVPGDVIVIDAPDRKLPMAVMRVATIDDTSETDGKITIGMAQDTFGLPLTPFVEPQQAAWLEPNMNPTSIVDQIGTDVTYRDICKFGSGDVANNLPMDHSFMVLIARAPSPAAYAFDMQTSVAGYGSAVFSEWKTVGKGSFVKVSTLTHAINTTAKLLRVRGDFTRRNITVGMCLMITDMTQFDPGGQEFVRLDAISDNGDGTITITVGRGCVDTPAKPHPIRAFVWAYDQAGIPDTTEYLKYDYVGMRGLTITSRGTLPMNKATHWTAANAFRRAFLPYSAADFRVNGLPRDQVFDAIGPNPVFTWSHRNRDTQREILIDESASYITPEGGTYYGLIIQGTKADGGQVYYFTPNQPSVTSGNGTVNSTQVFFDDHLVLEGSIMASLGVVPGPMSATLITYRRNDPFSPFPSQSLRWPTISFIYTYDGTPPPPVVLPTSGWGVNFGSNFGG